MQNKQFILQLCLALLFCGIGFNSEARQQDFKSNGIVAHRGAWKNRSLPGNSVASLKHAIELQCAGSEFDVQMTANEPELVFERMKQSPAYHQMKLVWSDEFDTNGFPDTTKWSYAVGGNGWGNNEAQYYTQNDSLNAYVKDGNLNITARKQDKENKHYTSARLLTKAKAEFKYGKIEVRARLPRGRGTWPAIWMLGNNIDEVGWPASGEIDIMEHVGYQPDSIFGTIHSEAYNHMKGTQKVKSISCADPYDQFHVYAMDWTPEKIDFSMDGKVYNRIVNEHLSRKEWPFDQPFYLIVNLAIGGGWGGKMGIDDTVFPAVFQLDYIRVFQTSSN